MSGAALVIFAESGMKVVSKVRYNYKCYGTESFPSCKISTSSLLNYQAFPCRLSDATRSTNSVRLHVILILARRNILLLCPSRDIVEFLGMCFTPVPLFPFLLGCLLFRMCAGRCRAWIIGGLVWTGRPDLRGLAVERSK